ncbi:MAG: thiamine pyrophosphate-binding protein, partial [bacterium]|nr:thiamine pyrophosphate-binding protein [bacterium]
VFTTTGPGTLNALTGIMAARWDGAKLILVSGATSAPQRGRWASQETSSYTMPQDALYSKGRLFDFAVRMESPVEFPEVARRLSLGMSRPGGFVAHVCLPMGVQSNRVDLPSRCAAATIAAPSVGEDQIAACLERLNQGPFAVWVGFGATAAAPLVKTLVERTGARIFCSPRGKGIIPEDHPNFLGVTGLGGHEAVVDYMVQEKPRWVLVLGTRLGEATSFWDDDLTPSEGFLHVDLDPSVPGTAYPHTQTLGIQADVSQFLTALLERLPQTRPQAVSTYTRFWEEPVLMRVKGREPVRPQVLMQAIQRHVVQRSNVPVLAESGNSFAWCTHYLRFLTPGRYRASTLFGSMGHAASGVVGAALARGGRAVAVVGDGSMLMNSEVNTAVQYQVPAVWIVLNDAGYGVCRDGNRALGLTGEGLDFPQVDFTAFARALGADGVRVRTEDEVDPAIRRALAATGPFIVDVHIDTDELSPLLRRFENLIRQGSSKNVASWHT